MLKRFHRVHLISCALGLLLAMLALPPSALGEEAGTPVVDPPEFHQTFRLPLSGGKLQLNSLLGTLLEYAGMGGGLLDGFPDMSVDVKGATGRLTVKTIAFATRGIVTIAVEGDGTNQALLARLDRMAMREQRANFQSRLLRLVEAWEPQAAVKLRASHGMFFHQSKGKPLALGEGKIAGNGSKVVVLVHGLDEPGWCWDTIAPALVKEGFTVCEFRYPNDQAIEKSSKLLVENLILLRVAGAKQVAIVAHSMGALVARDALTRADGYGGKGDGGETMPTVTRLIMLGPPNQGSALAELQLIGEVREHVVRLFTGDGHLFGAFFDGAGEAKEDLLPGSTFIKNLNARPLPTGVKMTILASQVSPVNGKQIATMREKVRAKVGADLAWGPDQIAAVATGLAEGMGDGAVPVASTKLAGVTDHVMVPGNHSSMLHKNTGEVTALGEIMKRLKE